MSSKLFEIYDAIAANVPEERLNFVHEGKFWTLAETDKGSGLAMDTEGDSIAPMFPGGITGMSTAEAAQAIKSWNLRETGLGLAAVNSALNTMERLEKLHCYEPFQNYCTEGLDFRGKTVGMIGHMHGPENMRREAEKVYIMEREPREGDYPDSACDFLLPECDIVLITGSTLVNKTLPHLLELCRNAYTIVTGPSVPMCPELLDFGIDRLAGLVPEDREALHRHVTENLPGSPYRMGRPFLLKK